MARIYNQNVWGNIPKAEKIANRNTLIRSLIYQHQPDVCTFQECNPSTSRQGEEALHVILSDIYVEASLQDAWHNFTPVFYKKHKYREIESGFHPYEGENDLQSKSLTWVVLEEILKGERFAVVSTHFWFKHQSEEDVLQRLQNVEELEKICKYIVHTYHVPVIIAGDLNCGKQSLQGDGPYRAMIEKGFVDVRYSAADTTECHTVHHYPVMNDHDEYIHGDMPHSTIDYIFMYGPKNFALQRFQVDISHMALCSSDHCPLIVDFIL